MNELHGNRVLILGYGREGQSVHRYIATHFKDLTIGIADEKEIQPLMVAKTHTGKSYLESLNGYDTVIRSPGIPASLQELTAYKKQGGWVTTATNIFFSQCSGKTIGITGTKGKSTTASLITHILTHSETYRDVRLVGNIGKPMLDHLEDAKKETIFVIELSSHQLEDVRYSPHIAIVLAIVSEHLDYYSSFETYVRAKSNITRFQKPEDIVIFNPNNSASSKIADNSKGKKLPIDDNMKSSDAILKGNRENILVSATVAKYLRVSPQLVEQAIASFLPLPHRLEFIGEYRGILFYNDSLATIPEATIHALDALGGNVETLIAGGFDRGLDYRSLGLYISKYPLKTLILFPDTGKKIRDAIDAHQKSLRLRSGQAHISYHEAKTMEEAVKLAYEHTSRGKICLLSPASASFNLFKDYEDRGNQFREWVLKIAS